MKKFGQIASNIFLVFAICVVIYCSYIAVKSKKNDEEIFIFGYKPYIIKTGSMEPGIKINACVIIKQGEFEDVKVNDIISFSLPETNINICHRVIGIEDGKLITKGDNNNKEDMWTVSEENYIGKLVVTANFTAYVLQNPLLIIIIIAVIIAIVAIKILIKNTSKKQ